LPHPVPGLAAALQSVTNDSRRPDMAHMVVGCRFDRQVYGDEINLV